MNLSFVFIKKVISLRFNLNPRLIHIMSSIHQSVHETARIGFSKEVENYEKARPTYSSDAFKIALNAFNVTGSCDKINVLDLAAGTGKFTR